MQVRQGSGQGGFRAWRVAWLVLCAALAGCGDDAEPMRPAAGAPLVPADPALAQLYATSCKQCHANPAAGAPLTGDTLAWAPRIDKGMDTLLEHSINGFQGMPPMGMCMQCSEEQFRALIGFMAALSHDAEGH